MEDTEAESLQRLLETRSPYAFRNAHLGQSGQLMKSGVAVEKLGISEIRANLGDGKCLGDPRRSFVGHPDAILFLRFLRE
jgi:hypothetical protein